MRKILIFSIFIFVACRSPHYVVESDYSYTGNFKKYKTFGFMSDNSAYNDSAKISQKILRDAIRYRMEIQGYKFTDKQPNLSISYRFFDKNVSYKGYSQPDIHYWVKRNPQKIGYKAVKYELKEGTLIVTFFDHQQLSTIWQGYASGIFGNIQLADNQKYIQKAVRNIFDQYRILAHEFDKKK